MLSIPQTTNNGNSISDFATKFMKRFHLGNLLFQCNAGKEKGIPVMDVFRFLFCMMFSDRTMVKKSKTKYLYNGEKLNVKEISLRDFLTSYLPSSFPVT